MGIFLPTHSNVTKAKTWSPNWGVGLSLTYDMYTIYNIILPQFCKDFKCWLHLDSYEINHNLYEHSPSQYISWSTHLYLTINSSRSGFTLCSILGQCALVEWLFGLLPMCVPFVRWSYSFGLYGFLVEWGWGIVFGVCLAHFNSIHTTTSLPPTQWITYIYEVQMWWDHWSFTPLFNYVYHYPSIFSCHLSFFYYYASCEGEKAPTHSSLTFHPIITHVTNPPSPP